MTARVSPNARFWDKTARRYSRRPISDQESYERKLELTREQFRPDMHVLEFGCGTGSTAILHAPHVSHILASDVSGKMLAIGRERAREAGVENIHFEQAGFEDLDCPDAAFDAVLGLNILHLMGDPGAAVHKVWRLLKPGGVFISSTACVGDMNPFVRLALPLMKLAGKAPHVTVLRNERLIAMVEAPGFQITENWRPKDGATVFLIARKPAGSAVLVDADQKDDEGERKQD